ncbi:MAG: aldehyde ferredoxin oxidoreductase, partial [Alphaproteobacteria bacterium]|nr:aldehyde ferredoxin oxidoreductase [Alphaproteobacteria bacterium]
MKMRKFITIDLGKKTTASRDLSGREIAKSGRYLIARMLLDQNIATVDPMAPENPLIFSVG